MQCISPPRNCLPIDEQQLWLPRITVTHNLLLLNVTQMKHLNKYCCKQTKITNIQKIMYTAITPVDQKGCWMFCWHFLFFFICYVFVCHVKKCLLLYRFLLAIRTFMHILCKTFYKNLYFYQMIECKTNNFCYILIKSN